MVRLDNIQSILALVATEPVPGVGIGEVGGFKSA